MCEREFAQWQRDNKEATAKVEAQEPAAARPAVNGASSLPQVAHVERVNERVFFYAAGCCCCCCC